MMNTYHVTGIAVVEPLVGAHGGLYRVCLSLCYKDGHVEPCTLVFHDAAHPPSNMKLSEELVGGEPIWCFKKDAPRHGWLDCQPSIRQRVSTDPNAPDRFHNTFNWQTQYVWLKYTACDARFNVWKELNAWGTYTHEGEDVPMPPVTADTFRRLRDDGYIC